MSDAHGQPLQRDQLPFTALKPAHSYARTPPRTFNLISHKPAVLQRFQTIVAEPVAQCPAEGFYHLGHCYVYDACYVLASSLEWIADTVIDLGVADRIKTVLRDVIAGGHQRKLPPSPYKTVLIAKAGAANYGHTLTDILPKLVHIARAGFTAVRLLLPDTMQRFVGLIGAVLAELGVRTLEMEWVAPATLREAEDIYVFSPVALHNTRKSTTFLELRDVLARIYDVRFSASRRLYLRRSPTESRKIANAGDVEALFARWGFQSVYPPDLSLQQQIHLFASASHIAGGLGAGLANVGLAPQSCEVLMIDPGLGDFYFWDFSCLLGQRFNWLFAGPLAGFSFELAQGEYSVGLGELDAALQVMLG
jgi:hypothetical protein